MAKNKIICLNLDTVKNKNIYQFDEMKKFDYQYICCGYLDNKANIDSSNYEYYKYPISIISRVKFVFNLLIENKKELSHIELYTGAGSFLVAEYILSKLFFLPVVVVERGSPLKDLNLHYRGIGYWGRKFVFRYANKVWIRELWMIDELTKIRKKDYFFLSNAISVSDKYNFSSAKKIIFSWMNSLKKWRNVPWFIDVLNHNDFKYTKNILMGIMDSKNKDVASQEKYVVDNKPNNLSVYNFGDPDRFAFDSKFFVLPADIVYLNFSLIESMGKGIVPIVSDVDGAREIVDDGINGIVAKHSKEGLEEAMHKAINMTKDEYETMSKNARTNVVDKFSVESWAKELNTMYKDLK